MNEKTIWFVRHGESTGNVDYSEYLRVGDSQLELTEKGKSQSRDAAKKIVEISQKLDSGAKRLAMFVSTYKRAVQTSEIIVEELAKEQSPLVSVERKSFTPLLCERKWGDLKHEVQRTDDRKHLFDFYYTPNGGESFADAYQRVVLFDMWMRSATKYENILVVAHGELIKLYFMYLQGWSVEEFEKHRYPRNGEVLLVNWFKTFSSLTPFDIN